MSPGQPPVVTGIPYGPAPVSLTCFHYNVVIMDVYRLYGLPSKTLFIFVMDDYNDTSSVILITMDYSGIVIVCITGAPDPQVRGATSTLSYNPNPRSRCSQVGVSGTLWYRRRYTVYKRRRRQGCQCY